MLGPAPRDWGVGQVLFYMPLGWGFGSGLASALLFLLDSFRRNGRRKNMNSRGSAAMAAVNGSDKPGDSSTGQLLPRWDAMRRELVVDGQIVKRFRLPAVNQVAVLAAFEEEGWSSRIFDPLPPHAGQDLQATTARDREVAESFSSCADHSFPRRRHRPRRSLGMGLRLAMIPPPPSPRPHPMLP